MDPIAAVAVQFVGAAAEEFPTSPLYQALQPIPQRVNAGGHLTVGRRRIATAAATSAA
jgi:hypothetical protein